MTLRIGISAVPTDRANLQDLHLVDPRSRPSAILELEGASPSTMEDEVVDVLEEPLRGGETSSASTS